MSKTLKLDTLKGFKPSGVNIDKSIIDNALKEFSDTRAEFTDSASNDDENLQIVKNGYEEEIALLKKRVEIAESQDRPLSKNEEKLINAIKSERINQNLDEPIIGRNMLIKKYKMNSKYLDESIKSLELRKIVERKLVPYSSKIMTHSWKLLLG